MLSKFVLLVALFPGTIMFAHADEASHTAKVHEFFKVAKLDQLSTQIMNQTMEQVDSTMMQQMFGLKLTGEQQKSLDEFKVKVFNVLSSALSWDKLEPEYTRMYAAAFTEQQMDDILAFYKSSTGQAMIEKSPLLVKESSAVAQQRMAVAMPEIQKLMKDYTAQQGNKSTQRTPAP